MRRLALLAWLLVIGAIVAPAARGSEPVEAYELWYVLEVQGQKAGWMRERVAPTGAGHIRSETEMAIKLARLGQNVELSFKYGVLETRDGEMIEARISQDFGAASMQSRYVFGPESIKVIMKQLGLTQEKERPIPEGDWLTPVEAERYVRSRLEAGAGEISYELLDLSSGVNVVSVRQTIVGETEVQVMGRTVPAIEWLAEQSLLPGVQMREFVDADGRMVRGSLDMGGMSITILAADEALARSEFDAPELMERTLLRPSRPIASPRHSTRGSYVLRVEGGEMPELSHAGAQRVERLPDGAVRVMVDVHDPLAAPEEDVRNGAYRESSSMIDSEDPEIVALVEEATRGAGDDPMDRAKAMERFVVTYVKEKSLGVGFATASEVCRTREGDCSEHAALLVALLRADGIPARGVTGLVYVDQFVGERSVFGYHMWAQALLEVDGAPRWIDLDAAVYPMDATHIALSTSDMGDGTVNFIVALADVMGRLSIEVESVE